MRYTTAKDSNAAGVTYHLLPAEVWEKHKDDEEYLPEAFAQDGFIHCTDGLDELTAAGNRFYTGDVRPYLALILNVKKIGSAMRYEDPEEMFPHIYGPLNTSAVVGTLEIARDADGSFLPFSHEECYGKAREVM